jgi:hypothetical protein
VRRRKWKILKGETREAWVVDCYVDHQGKRHLKTCGPLKDAVAFSARMAVAPIKVDWADAMRLSDHVMEVAQGMYGRGGGLKEEDHAALIEAALLLRQIGGLGGNAMSPPPQPPR